MTLGTRHFARTALLGLVLGALLAPPASRADGPASLKTVPVPTATNLDRYVSDQAAAIRLGKALFWDMQVGSDGKTACATCHFHAGTDHRTRNTLSQGPDASFQAAGSNADLSLADFPFHQPADPENRGSGGLLDPDPAVLRSLDDRVGAQGVALTRFLGTRDGNPVEPGRLLQQGAKAHGLSVRQTTGRNAPTVINAVFNYANFWDGRANFYFNGVNPFGVQDVNVGPWINNGGTLVQLDMSDPANQLKNSSLASQATGPPLSDVEMSWRGRNWPDIAHKLLDLRPLTGQQVHPQDSVLAGLVQAGGTGLATTYRAMVQQAFRPEFWNSPAQINGHPQIEANFSLFFGLAVQLYEATLVSDDTPFDRFQEGDATALSDSAVRGMNTFFSGGTNCSLCHVGTEFTAHSIANATNPLEPGLLETMNMGDGNLASYDIGFYNIGVTRTADDLGRGADDPFGNPLSFSRQRAIVNGHDTADTGNGQLTFDPAFVPAPGCVPDLLADVPLICPPNLNTVTRTAINGNFKAPGLRNVELTGPYMHNGGMATLMQVIDFYTRGGNFREASLNDLDPFINDIPGLKGPAGETAQRELVDFLKALTDERVRWEQAPFDHPQLLIPQGHKHSISGNPKRTRVLDDQTLEVPAVGRNGRQVEGLPPSSRFSPTYR